MGLPSKKDYVYCFKGERNIKICSYSQAFFTGEAKLTSMPEVCRFFGIIIRMFPNDHLPAHFHAYYNECKATFNIRTGKLIDGKFPSKQAAL